MCNPRKRLLELDDEDFAALHPPIDIERVMQEEEELMRRLLPGPPLFIRRDEPMPLLIESTPYDSPPVFEQFYDIELEQKHLRLISDCEKIALDDPDLVKRVREQMAEAARVTILAMYEQIFNQATTKNGDAHEMMSQIESDANTVP